MPAAGLRVGSLLSGRKQSRPKAGCSQKWPAPQGQATYERRQRLRFYSHDKLQPLGGSSRHIGGEKIAMTIKRLTGLIALAVAPAIYASSANAPLGTVENKVRHELLMLPYYNI